MIKGHDHYLYCDVCREFFVSNIETGFICPKCLTSYADKAIKPRHLEYAKLLTLDTRELEGNTARYKEFYTIPCLKCNHKGITVYITDNYQMYGKCDTCSYTYPFRLNYTFALQNKVAKQLERSIENYNLRKQKQERNQTMMTRSFIESFDAEAVRVEDLKIQVAFEELLSERMTDEKWLTDLLSSHQSILKARTRAEKERLLKKLKANRENLKSAEEKRKDVEAQIAALSKELES